MKITGAWLTVNRACNMRCPWCYASSTKFDHAATMEADLAYRLLDLFSDLGVKGVVILGGEPTVYPHLLEVIRYTVSRNMKPVIVTNGKRLSNLSYARLLQATGIKDITISLKAVESEGYRPLRISDDTDLFEQVCAAIKNVQRVGIGLNVSVTLVRSLDGKLERLVELLTKLNPKHVTVDMGTPVIKPDGTDGEGILNPLELAEIVARLYEILKPTSLNYSFYLSIPLCLIDPKIRSEMIGAGRVLTTCHVPKGQGVVFTPEGSVILCNHFSSFPIGRFGIDFTSAQEFEVFWNSTSVTKLRSRASEFPHERCQTCDDWDICGGGCFVKWLHWNPELFIPEKGGDKYERASAVS